MQMTVRWKINDDITVEATGETAAEAHQAISQLYEVYGSETQCRLCKCKRLKPVARVVEGNSFFELVCANYECKAKFSIGQSKTKGGLFPQRKDKDGNWKPNGGWAKWEGKKQDADDAHEDGHVADTPAKRGSPKKLF